MSVAEKIVTIKHLLPFNGKAERWRPWKKKFLVQASRKGYKGVLLGDDVILQQSAINALSGTTKTDAEDEKKKLVALNDLAYEDLILSMDDKTPEGKVVFNIIDMAETPGHLPDGDAPLAWKRLTTKFEPKETGSRLQCRDNFQNKVLKSIKVDPEVFITELRMCQQLWVNAGGQCTDDDVLENLMNNMPEAYDSIYNLNWSRVRATVNPYTVDELTRDLKRIYDRKNKSNGGAKTDDDDGETALFAQSGKQFKGRCNKCGKWGHKGADCRSNNDTGDSNQGNSGGKFRGKCFLCGKVGHKKEDCWHNNKDGKPTREWLSREESASPTVAQDSIVLTCMIDCHEGRDIVMIDAPNAFIQAMLPRGPNIDKIIMKITGVLIDMMLDMAPHVYGGFVVYKKGKRVLYVEVIHAIYGMLISSLLWYRKFRAELEEFGFEFNPYDACVANRTVNGSQQTIRFHVDDLLASHVDPAVNNELHRWIEYTYGDLGPVKLERGNEHDYLGVIYLERKRFESTTIPTTSITTLRILEMKSGGETQRNRMF